MTCQVGSDLLNLALLSERRVQGCQAAFSKLIIAFSDTEHLCEIRTDQDAGELCTRSQLVTSLTAKRGDPDRLVGLTTLYGH